MKASKFSLLALTLAVLATAFTTSTARADVDFDFDNGTLYIETDEHDDVVFPVVEDDELVVYVFQFNPGEQNLDELKQLVFMTNVFCGIPYFDVDELRQLAERRRVWDRDIDDVHRIVVRTHEGNDFVFAARIEIPVYVYAGADDDFVMGSIERNYIFGESGDDELEIHYYNDFNNLISGGPGADDLQGGSGRDVLYGDAGDDVIHGSSGNDRIYGGDDDDILRGSYGDDYIHGGSGADDLIDFHGGAYMEGGYDGEVDRLTGDKVEVVGFYFRYLTPHKPNKNFMIRLETEEVEVYGSSVIKGVIK